jgi:YD repeat-containing protein
LPGNHPGRLEAVVLADGTQERLCHDAEGRLLAHTDPLGRRTVYRYDPSGLLAQRVDAQGHSLHYRWDALGRLAELRNENGQPYGFEYDPVGRLLAEVGFDGQRTEYRYAESTGVLAEVVEGPVTTQLGFDPMGRLVRRQAVVPGRPEQTESFGYLPGGQLGEARNAQAKLQFVYDAAGRLVREHHHYLDLKQTAVWQHRYDELGHRVGTTRPDGHRLEWLTYGSGHVHGLLLDGQEVVGFERDALHR